MKYQLLDEQYQTNHNPDLDKAISMKHFKQIKCDNTLIKRFKINMKEPV